MFLASSAALKWLHKCNSIVFNTKTGYYKMRFCRILRLLPRTALWRTGQQLSWTLKIQRRRKQLGTTAIFIIILIIQNTVTTIIPNISTLQFRIKLSILILPVIIPTTLSIITLSTINPITISISSMVGWVIRMSVISPVFFPASFFFT